MKSTTRTLIGFLSATTLLIGCGNGSADVFDPNNEPPQPPLDTTPTTTIAPKRSTINSFLVSAPNFTILAELVTLAGVDSILNDGKKHTVLAPSDTVMRAFSATTLQSLRKDKRALRAFILNHIIDVEAMSIDFLMGRITMMSGLEVDVRLGDRITLNGQPLSKVDNRFKDGVVHELAGVLTD